MFPRSLTALLPTQNAESPILPTLHRQLTDKNAESTNFPDPSPNDTNGFCIFTHSIPALYLLLADNNSNQKSQLVNFTQLTPSFYPTIYSR
jgi:hypothetical protein